tara:strand:+ start:310 stop:903 length:594 start_codon:yes stop_codon:yes gene_type:complete
MNIEVIDNFLPNNIFYPFASSCMKNAMYKPFDYTANEEEADGSISLFGQKLKKNTNFAEIQFQALIYLKTQNENYESDFWLSNLDVFKNLKNLLNVESWVQLRANCTTGQPTQHVGGYHVDFVFPNSKNYKTCILYLNSNNGGTIVQDTDTLIKSEKNRLLKFPTSTMHAGVWATDAKLRFVLNMTYIENENRYRKI